MGWMYWTIPSGIFFGVIFLLLAGMLIWQIVQPTDERRGWIIPMRTTRGDRFFISLLASAYLTAIWIGWVPASPWWVLVISVALLIVLLRWG